MTADSDANPQPVGTLWLRILSNAEWGMGDSESKGDSESPIPHSAFHRVGPEAAGELAEAMGLDGPGPVLERFAGGRGCYVVRLEGILVSYGWVSTGEEWVKYHMAKASGFYASSEL